jgi:hypothetical protein
MAVEVTGSLLVLVRPVGPAAEPPVVEPPEEQAVAKRSVAVAKPAVAARMNRRLLPRRGPASVIPISLGVSAASTLGVRCWRILGLTGVHVKGHI